MHHVLLTQETDTISRAGAAMDSQDIPFQTDTTVLVPWKAWPTLKQNDVLTHDTDAYQALVSPGACAADTIDHWLRVIETADGSTARHMPSVIVTVHSTAATGRHVNRRARFDPLWRRTEFVPTLIT
jgi:hypothetical protein